MMAEDKNKNVRQEEVDVITLEFEEGEPVDCEIMGVFDIDGKDYIALIPDFLAVGGFLELIQIQQAPADHHVLGQGHWPK